MQNIILDIPYVPIPPYRGRLWPAILSRFAPRVLRNPYGVTKVDCMNTQRLVDSIRAGHGVFRARRDDHPRKATKILSLSFIQHRALNRLLAASDERTRRLLAGFLARQQGRGGIALLARISGLDRDTIARGQRELRQPFQPASRIRRPGAGGQRVEKKAQRS